MSRFPTLRVFGLVVLVLLCGLPATPPLPGAGWPPHGQPFGGREAAPVPEFLRTQAAVAEIEYLGPEPDRWRSANEQELDAAQAPEQ